MAGKIKETVDTYFSETTVHGFSYVHSNRRLAVRILWVNLVKHQ